MSLLHSRRRELEMAIPLLLVGVVAALFVFPVRAYFECRYVNCKPIAQSLTGANNLTGLLALADQESHTIPAGETAENKAKRENEIFIRSHDRAALTAAGRINFLFFTMLYLSLCALALFVGCYVISNACGPKKLWCILAVVLIAAVSSAWLYFNFENHMRIFTPLMLETVNHDLPAAWQLQRLSNSFGFTMILILTLGSSAALYPRTSRSFPDGLLQIAAQMWHLRLILYVGTFMLVVGVLQARSVYQWSEAYLVRDERLVKIADNFFSGLLAVEGGYFTLLLAVVYLPAAFILRLRADAVEPLPALEAAKEQVLQQYGVAFSLMQSVPRVVAILGPLLVGPVGELFGRVV